MNTKKIWLLAILFGVLTSVIFIILTTNNGNNDDNDKSAPTAEDAAETDNQKNTNAKTLDILPGNRAISLAVNAVQSVSGFVQPGAYVDVIVIQPSPDDDSLTSRIFLENVRVLAVGKTSAAEEADSEDKKPYEMVTLEVSPTEGASLALETERSIVTLMLRGIEDTKAASE